MKNKNTVIFVFLNIILLVFYSCEGMATLFHGTKPEEPPVTYTVTFNGNGADGIAPSAQTVNADTIISLPGKGSLASAGNIFMGWNEIPAGGGTTYSAGSPVKITGTIAFYAQWLDSSTPQYTVTFNVNGATGGMPPASQTVYSGVSIIIPNQGTLSYNGKIFAGWNTGADGLGINYTTGDIFLVTTNTALYVKWETDLSMVIPAKPTGLSASVISSSGIKITWNAVQGATGYKIYRSSGGEYTLVGTSSTTEYTNTGLTLSIMYYYKVSATNIIGEGMQSDYIEISIELPVTPTNVIATPESKNSIKIVWDQVNGATLYEIYQVVYDAIGGYYRKIGISTTHLYIHGNLDEGLYKQYEYSIKAINAIGSSQYSSRPTSYVRPIPLTNDVWYTSSVNGWDAWSSSTTRYFSFPASAQLNYISLKDNRSFQSYNIATVSCYWRGSDTIGMGTELFINVGNLTSTPKAVDPIGTGYIVIAVKGDWRGGGSFSIRYYTD
jgi:fibronectin type 3 domain-containing protein